MTLPPIDPVDLDSCRARLAGGSRSFLLASRLLPAPAAESATVFYAFCRVADDAIDESAATAPGAAAAVARLHGRLRRIYNGEPEPRAEDRALAIVVRRHGVPQALLQALVEGFEWDAAGRRYATLAELEDYAARVAGSVGAVMALLLGERCPRQLARACELGVAMQLTNICRDVAEDAAMGRLYLPEDLLRRAGIDPTAWLAAPVSSAGVVVVVEALLARADALYRRAEQGVRRLPWRFRPGIGAAARLYEAIGHALRNQHGDPFQARARVPRQRQLTLLLRSLRRPPSDPAAWQAAPIASVQYLVDVVREAEAPPVRDRWASLIELLIRLERRTHSLPRPPNA